MCKILGNCESVAIRAMRFLALHFRHYRRRRRSAPSSVQLQFHVIIRLCPLRYLHLISSLISISSPEEHDTDWLLSAELRRFSFCTRMWRRRSSDQGERGRAAKFTVHDRVYLCRAQVNNRNCITNVLLFIAHKLYSYCFPRKYSHSQLHSDRLHDTREQKESV